MAKKQETGIKEQFFREIKKLGRKVWTEKIQQVSKRGTPDIIGCAQCHLCGRGLFFAPELKIPGEEPDPLQQYKLGKIKEAGGHGFVYEKPSDLESLEDFLSRPLPTFEPKILQLMMESLNAQAQRQKK